MKFSAPLDFAPLSILAIAILTGGCTSVDEWSAWERDPLPVTHSVDSVEVPADFRPNPETAEVVPPDRHEVWHLSLEEATLRALQANRDLRAQQLNPVIAGSFELIERGIFDPQVFAELNYGEERAVEVDAGTAGQYGLNSEDASLTLGMRQLLPTGTQLELSYGQRYSLSNRTPEQHEARAGLTVTQSLLRGLGPSANLVRIWQAERDTLASIYELRGFTERLVADVESAYWRYVLAEEQIAIYESSLDIARRQRDEIEHQIDVGLLARTEGAAARAEVALRQQALIDARGTLQAARLQLAYLLDLGGEGDLQRAFVSLSSPRAEVNPITDLDSRIVVAGYLRPDLNEARLRLERDDLQTIITRNGLMPRLDFFVSLGQSGYGDRLGQSVRALDGASYDFQTGVTLSHALGNRTAQARDFGARATRQQARQALANLQVRVELEVRLAATEVERARQQIAASAISRELRELAASSEVERFEVGTSTALLVAQAQRDLLAAQIAEIKAVIDYRLALIQLYLAEGTLLERRGIILRSPSEPL